ncbi:protein kinase [Propionibacterium freudenreichii]|uniref:serine/threonine-protein kinase n=1 Tax=Propionibacterium freudenreichii TaxID=1744 RepID=UPI0024345934|nr:serine/threonine-protein kinase [Propionibacterium freudenreichii]WFF32550.1 protein kinase [Propionibacterium freudenreichii]
MSNDDATGRPPVRPGDQPSPDAGDQPASGAGVQPASDGQGADATPASGTRPDLPATDAPAAASGTTAGQPQPTEPSTTGPAAASPGAGGPVTSGKGADDTGTDDIAHETPIATLQDGRYRLVERVGAGSIGQVWRAYDATLQREVAVKTVNLAMSADPATGARFRREAVATAGLDHPNVVQIYDSGVDGHTAFIVMEFLHGPNLQTVVNQEGPIPYAVAVPLLAQVAAGLGAAHAIGVTHRDVKPANVVLATKSLHSTPKIVDFGIARLNDQQGTSLTSTMTAIGSAAYMSPEQASGNRVSQASDMYSFGCLITTVLTGRPPFPGESPIAVARAQVYDTPTPLRQLRADTPEALETLVTALLSKDPAGRPNARQTEQALRAIDSNAADAQKVVTSLIPVTPATNGNAPTVAIAGAAPAPTTPSERTTLIDATNTTAPATGAPAGASTDDAISTSSTRPVVRRPADASDAAAANKQRQRSQRVRRILLALIIIVILIGAVWFAFAERGRDTAPAPSTTVTMTTTPSPSATASYSNTSEPTYSQTYAPATTYAPSATTQPTQPAATVTETQPAATVTTTASPQAQTSPAAGN